MMVCVPVQILDRSGLGGFKCRDASIYQIVEYNVNEMWIFLRIVLLNEGSSGAGRGVLSLEILRNELLTDLLFLTGVLKRKYIFISVRYIICNPLLR